MDLKEHNEPIHLTRRHRGAASSRQHDFRPGEDSSWRCPNCETWNNDTFCRVCGSQKETGFLKQPSPQDIRGTQRGLTLLLAAISVLILILLIFVSIRTFSGSHGSAESSPAPTELLSGISGADTTPMGHSTPTTPPSQSETPVLSTVSLPAIAGEIAQVEPMLSSSVAVLYTNGTVDVAGDENLAQKTASWQNVIRIWCTYDGIVGLLEDGRAVSTFLDLSGWQDVREIYVSYDRAAGITAQGRVLTAGNWDNPKGPAQWRNIRSLLLCEDCLYGIKEDGSIVGSGKTSLTVLQWKNVQELYDFMYFQAAILDDGSVVLSNDEPTQGLSGSTKLVFDDVLFGLSADGKLLTGTGKLYHNGSLYTENFPELNATPIALSQYRGIQDIFNGGYAAALLTLNQDGTADVINNWINFDLSGWNHITQICSALVDLEPRIYGLRSDGSVVVMAGNWNPQEINYYQGWNLRALYGSDNGVVGVTVDGNLVGDGDYSGISLP